MINIWSKNISIPLNICLFKNCLYQTLNHSFLEVASLKSIYNKAIDDKIHEFITFPFPSKKFFRKMGKLSEIATSVPFLRSIIFWNCPMGATWSKKGPPKKGKIRVSRDISFFNMSNGSEIFWLCRNQSDKCFH